MRRILLALIAICLASSTAWATVVHDASGTAACDANAATITCSTLTVGTGASNYVVVALVNYLATASSTNPTIAATWNGVAMSFVGALTNNTTNGGAAVLCLAAPASGNHSLVVTTTGNPALELHVIAVSFSGVDQTTPCAHFNAVRDFTGTLVTNTITTTSGDAAVASYSNSQVGPGSNPNLNGTPITAYGTDFNGPNISFEANYNTASGSTTALTDTGGGSATDWVTAGVDVQAAGGGGGGCTLLTRSRMGVGC